MDMSRSTCQHNSPQVDKLRQIGAVLQYVREDHLLTVDDIADRTLIQPRLLRAIEAGDLSQLPEPIYVQGFIKRYAECLGLNGTELANAFPLDSKFPVIQGNWQSSPAAQLRPMHLYIAYIALIMLAISGLSQVLGRSSSWSSANLGTETSTPGQARFGSAEDARSPSPVVAPASPSPGATSNKPVRVDVTLTASSWLRVEADGKTQFQGTLPEGTQKTWVANNELTVRAGNAGGVMVAYNQGKASPMGAQGAVEEVTFSIGQKSASLIGVGSSSSLLD